MTPLGRQVNGCVGTIVRVDTAAKRYGVNVDNLTIATYLMVRLLLMVIRLEMLLKAPARGWGDGCFNLDALIFNKIRCHLHGTMDNYIERQLFG